MLPAGGFPCQRRWLPVIVLAVTVVLLLWVGPAVASAAVRYASPSGVAPSGAGPYCTQSAPCDLISAMSGTGVAPGDTVLLEPGTYPTVMQTFETTLDLNIQGLGAHAADTVISIVGNFGLENLNSTISNLSLHVDGSLGFVFIGSVAQRLVVTTTGSGGIERACTIYAGVLRDSVCASPNGKAAVYAQSASASQTPGAISVTLRNVTAYSTGPFSAALLVGGVSGAPATVNVTNSILRDVGGYADIRTYSEQAEPVAVNLDHSNFGSVQPASPTDTITAPGAGAGNQTANPLFVNPAFLNLREAAGSPTINAGTSSGVVAGEVDLDGNPRIADGAPDIGAYEFPANTPPHQKTTAHVSVPGGQHIVRTNKKKGAPVKLSCGTGDIGCRGTLTLTAKVKKVTFVRVHKKKKRKVKTVTVTLGSARFTLSPRHSGTVTVPLSGSARATIRAAGKGGLKTHATARTSANTASSDLRLFY